MTALDSSSLKFWEVFSEIGFVLVIVGVAGEAVELFERLVRRKSARIFWAKVFWGILVFGLAMEFLGSHNASRIADTENAKLSKLAGEAAERAAKAESSNLKLKFMLSEMGRAQKPRLELLSEGHFLDRIKGKQTGEVVVLYEPGDQETFRFAEDLLSDLREAGWRGADFPQMIPPDMVATNSRLPPEKLRQSPLIMQATGIGIPLHFVSQKVDSAHCVVVKNALLSCGLRPIVTTPDPSLPPDKILIIVGKKWL